LLHLEAMKNTVSDYIEFLRCKHVRLALCVVALIHFNFFTALADEKPSFWSKTDEFLMQTAEVLSKKDKITGLRSLNTVSDKQARQRGEATLQLILDEANRQKVKIFKSGDAEFERVSRIVERVVRASHYRDEEKIRFEVVDFEDVNAFAFGGGNFIVFTGLMNVANDDELAYIIAHELAHNAASHNEEQENFLRFKDVVGKKPSSEYRTVFTNVNEQEADRVGIIYTALAGFDPCASATFWEKQKTYLEEYSIFRTHPVNIERAATNRKVCKVVSKYYKKGEVSADVERVLRCNELFCNDLSEELAAGEGGGFLAMLEVLADSYIKNEQAKTEQKKQEQQKIEANRLLAEQKRLAVPNVHWLAGWNVYKGTIQRHNERSGLNFGIAQQQGEFYYNFNNQIQKGTMRYHSRNQNGIWFTWQDNWATGMISLKEYTDGSLRGQIFMNDGTNPGKYLGEFIGFR
jgi:predicted Zn-dependent protease